MNLREPTASSSRQAIDQAISKALSEAKAVGLRIPSDTPHPRKYLVGHNEEQISLWIYCWMLTPGGRPTLPQEYRIQMTSVQSPLEMNPNGYTVLLGYEQKRGVFAGYDLGRHTTFTSGSPSVQVNIEAMNRALQTGLAFETKSNQEIVVGVRSDLLLFYCRNAAEFHRLREDAVSLEMISRASNLGDVPSDFMSAIPEQRQKFVQETVRWSRSASFRRQVLGAYDHRCAVTRQQLGLVDAAHILPVAAGSESIDNVRNGIALSPTFHRAFDNGLIYLDLKMEMRLNPFAVTELDRLGLAGGLQEFGSNLGIVHLPYDAQQHPSPHFIELANRYRGLA